MAGTRQELYRRIHYTFKNSQLLELALTHASLNPNRNNERLEFLGDAALELCTSEYLYTSMPDSDEGALTKRRASFVCEPALAYWARTIHLSSYIKLGKSEEGSGGREKNSILSDTVEAILGAVYLDGGFEAVRGVVQNLLQTVEAYAQQAEEVHDAKTELQVLLQQKGNIDLTYDVYKTEGPPHDTTFYVELRFQGQPLARGQGKSKKAAEQAAAALALQKLLHSTK